MKTELLWASYVLMWAVGVCSGAIICHFDTEHWLHIKGDITTTAFILSLNLAVFVLFLIAYCKKKE